MSDNLNLKWPEFELGGPAPKTPGDFKKLAEYMITFCKQEHILKFAQFLNEYMITRERMSRWCDVSPEMYEAKKICMEIIGTRRELGALKKELNESIVRQTLTYYDEDYAKHFKEMKVEITEDRNITINIPAFPSVAEVRPAQEKDE